MTPGLRLAVPELAIRKSIIQSAESLLQSGEVPALADAAEAAGLDRRLAEELFPGQGALLLEAALLAGLPDVDEVFPNATAPVDPGDRIETVATLLHHHIGERARLIPDRILGRVLALALRTADADGLDSVVRLPVIDAAVQPLEDTLSLTALHHLCTSLTLLVVAQSLLAANGPDELGRRRSLGDLCWSCRTLVRGALAQQGLG